MANPPSAVQEFFARHGIHVETRETGPIPQLVASGLGSILGSVKLKQAGSRHQLQAAGLRRRILDVVALDNGGEDRSQDIFVSIGDILWRGDGVLIRQLALQPERHGLLSSVAAKRVLAVLWHGTKKPFEIE